MLLFKETETTALQCIFSNMFTYRNTEIVYSQHIHIQLPSRFYNKRFTILALSHTYPATCRPRSLCPSIWFLIHFEMICSHHRNFTHILQCAWHYSKLNALYDFSFPKCALGSISGMAIREPEKIIKLTSNHGIVSFSQYYCIIVVVVTAKVDFHTCLCNTKGQSALGLLSSLLRPSTSSQT